MHENVATTALFTCHFNKALIIYKLIFCISFTNSKPAILSKLTGGLKKMLNSVLYSATSSLEQVFFERGHLSMCSMVSSSPELHLHKVFFVEVPLPTWKHDLLYRPPEKKAIERAPFGSRSIVVWCEVRDI